MIAYMASHTSNDDQRGGAVSAITFKEISPCRLQHFLCQKISVGYDSHGPSNLSQEHHCGSNAQSKSIDTSDLRH